MHLYGNKKALTILQRSIKNNKVAHAYLFTGPSGVGKKHYALYFAKLINCDSASSLPCDQCSSCLKITQSLHPDVKLFTPEGKQIKMEQIKEFSSFILSPPFEGKYKVLIIDDAHKMNPKAGNALLKTLEEPGSFSVIILITPNIKNLLPTIISRCVKINFSPLSQEDLRKILAEKGHKAEEIEKVLPYCEGSVERALHLLLPENLSLIGTLQDVLFPTNEAPSLSTIFRLSDEIVEDNKEELFFHIVNTLMRQKLIKLIGENEENPEIFSYINVLEKTIKFARLLRYNISRSFLIERALISLLKKGEIL